MEKEFVENMPKLGFGLMRLPHIDENTIDVEQTKVMVDRFLAAGMKYFDTAYVYPGSEDAIREALVKRYPRESYYLATKLNSRVANTAEEAKAQFEESLRRTEAQYFDFYLLHAIGESTLPKYDEFKIWDFVKQLKAEGKIKHYGFSFHHTPEVLERLLTEHPDVEFVQLQINYADWEDPKVNSGILYDICRRHNKPIVVMEPVKGGTLANPPATVRKILNEANPDVSLASWAIRYVASKEGILVVLSGMSNVEQMEDNLSFMKEFKPLSEEEAKTIERCQKVFRSTDQIPCTACHYCTPGCPMQINIPEIFAAMNQNLVFGEPEKAKEMYAEVLGAGSGRASDCIGCLQCEGACPQKIEITSWLGKIAEYMGE
ncbi:MAG: aldo/keto reductase [Erysipelotrichaceae bacterium]|nr:aldo/keto reductase [Erysipelotrichaceae bacterium]